MKNWKRKILIFLSFLSLPAIMLAAGDVLISNPVGQDIPSIQELLKIILRAITYIAIPIIVLAFIYSGFKFIKSQGDSTGITEAKKTFLSTLIATAIILGSNVILEVVVETTRGLGI